MIRRALSLLALLALIMGSCGADEPAPTTVPSPSTEVSTSVPATTNIVPTTGDSLETDVGVDDDQIRVGILSDPNGLQGGVSSDIVDAQLVYWGIVNAEGGIAGREVVPVVSAVSSPGGHNDAYDEIAGEVVAFSSVTDTLDSVGLLDRITADGVMVTPLGRYSGFADPIIDPGVVFEQGATYCLEAMNAVEFIGEDLESRDVANPRLAIVTRPGAYGEDAAAGAQFAAAQLGYEIAYDGIGELSVDAGEAAIEAVAGEIAAAQPNLVFVAVLPEQLAALIPSVAELGASPEWIGAGPSYDSELLDGDLGAPLTASYWISDTATQWGTDVPAMETVAAALAAAYPDRRPSNGLIIGWAHARQTEQILRLAAANGDMTRQGVIDAGRSIKLITLEGLGPDHTYAGAPDDYIVRTTSIFRPNLERYTEAGGADQRLDDGMTTTGSDIVELGYLGEVARRLTFEDACWTEAEGDRINE